MSWFRYRPGTWILTLTVLQGGGVYGDKAAAMERFRENYRTIVPDNVKARLVLENDEICYNVDDLLPICEELGIPLVLGKHSFQS